MRGCFYAYLPNANYRMARRVIYNIANKERRY